MNHTLPCMLCKCVSSGESVGDSEVQQQAQFPPFPCVPDSYFPFFTFTAFLLHDSAQLFSFLYFLYVHFIKK